MVGEMTAADAHAAMLARMRAREDERRGARSKQPSAEERARAAEERRRVHLQRRVVRAVETRPKLAQEGAGFDRSAYSRDPEVDVALLTTSVAADSGPEPRFPSAFWWAPMGAELAEAGRGLAGRAREEATELPAFCPARSPPFWAETQRLAMAAWSPALLSRSFRTSRVPLSRQSCQVMSGQRGGSGVPAGADGQAAAAAAAALEQRLDDEIAALGGVAFCKLDSRSPKDVIYAGQVGDTEAALIRTELSRRPAAFWRDAARPEAANAQALAVLRACHGALAVRSGCEALDMLLGSHRVVEDMRKCLAAAPVGDSGGADEEEDIMAMGIVLREFLDLDPALEFRVFVSNGHITALTQYFDAVIIDLDDALWSQAVEAVRDFCQELLPLLPTASCVVDMAVTRDGNVRLIELNPFHYTTGACLFDWGDAADLAVLVGDGSGTSPFVARRRDVLDERKLATSVSTGHWAVCAACLLGAVQSGDGGEPGPPSPLVLPIAPVPSGSDSSPDAAHTPPPTAGPDRRFPLPDGPCVLRGQAAAQAAGLHGYGAGAGAGALRQPPTAAAQPAGLSLAATPSSPPNQPSVLPVWPAIPTPPRRAPADASEVATYDTAALFDRAAGRPHPDVSEAEFEWMEARRPLAATPASLERDYGADEAGAMLAAFEAAGLSHLIPTLAWPGVGTRWPSFLAWAERWAAGTAGRTAGHGPAAALRAYGRHLGRVVSYQALALDAGALAKIVEADCIFPSGQLRVSAEELQAVVERSGVRTVCVARLYIAHLRRLLGHDPSISLHDDWQTTSLIATGYTSADRPIHLFELSVPAVESVGWTLQQVADRTAHVIPSMADADDNADGGWFQFGGCWFDGFLERTERYGFYGVPHLAARLRSLRVFDSREEVREAVAPFVAYQDGRHAAAAAAGPAPAASQGG